MMFLVFVSGFLGGVFFEVKKDDFKDQKIKSLEQILEIDTDSYSIHEDPFGQVWLTGPNECIQVY